MPDTDRAAIARSAAAGLRRFGASARTTPVMIGFDGFVDSIVHVVDKREDLDHYQPVETIERFGEKIRAAAGQSSNYEMVTQLQKLGGNGPIMANAMAAAGLAVTYIGTVGRPTLHPVFDELAQAAEVHGVAQPGFTDALEFTDGKVMLGKYTSVAQLDWQEINRTVPPQRFAGIVQRSRLIGMVNWTMLGRIETVWEQIEAVLAQADQPAPRPSIFIDLADPEKRTDQALRQAVEWIGRLERRADVILGLNLKEAAQVAAVLDIQLHEDREAAIETTARAIRDRMGLYAVVVHPRRGAAGAVRQSSRGPASRGGEDQVASAVFHGPFTAAPKLSTGAGDNFNAGFCLGHLADLPVEQCLCTGAATSGYYVRHGRSPTLDHLASFCDQLPEPEA